MDEMITTLNEELHLKKIPYVVIGGIAASLLGKPRMTMDSDIVIVLDNAKVPEFIHGMRQRGFSVSASSEPKIISRLQRGLPVKLRYRKHFSVDVRIAHYSLDTNAIRRAKSYHLFSVRLPIASPEDLVAFKIARFNALDQSDIQAIFAKQPKIDKSYLRIAAEQLVDETGNAQIQSNLEVALGWLKK